MWTDSRPTKLDGHRPAGGAAHATLRVVESPSLAAEHPTLTTIALELVEVLTRWSDQVVPAPGTNAWLHHIDLSNRTEDLARHLQGVLLLGEAGLFPSALALARTALEHHLLDRLMLLADRYEDIIRPTDPAEVDQWERDFEERSEPWTHDVTSIERTKDRQALKVVRTGHKVADTDEQISPYWVALEHYDPFLGHPDIQAATAQPFRSVEDLESWARRNQTVYGRFLKWNSILWNLQLSALVTPGDLVHLQVHYSFLSAFTHGTSSSSGTSRGMPGGPSTEHVLGELVLLYVIAIAIAEIRSWDTYINRRPQLLAPIGDEIKDGWSSGGLVIDYFWFLGGSPQPFDYYQEANRRAHPLLLSGKSPTFTPATIPSAEVGYYSNPIERLRRMHVGENEIMTGFGFSAVWPALHW